jgi:chorismate mutase-like protein
MPSLDLAKRALALMVAVGVLALARAANARPVLRVGTSGDYAPFSSRGRGFDVEVAEAMARDLGYRLRWVSFTWPTLQASAEGGDFDVAMSGVTWRPHRAIAGTLSRAVAAGGPCLLGIAPIGRVGVNRGGILEAHATRRFGAARLLVVDDNQALPGLLETGRVGAIVTDSFELSHFARDGWVSTCEPARDRKVYWVTRAAPAALAARLDDWIARNEPLLRTLRVRWFGAPQPRSDVSHLVDLLTRRLALMPSVAAYKREHGQPIEDQAREAKVLAAMRARASELGVSGRALNSLFELQIELAKAVQRRTPTDAAALPLDRVRKTLITLGDRILAALVDARRWPEIGAGDLEPLSDLLEPAEVARVARAVRDVQLEQRHRPQRQ